ncbi:hypothetical protein BBW65_06345 [Helicobacter enhydrae]|uniref:Glycosyl transferase family 1 domain-containing protein n=1 Tax=Helicobacter enhydrae TaxID=222136 RepID=A0A1B1U6Q2_9HELI|nr:glycosyltransferase family 4 protein [Helicobacter enhydrae]ANV98438.1 hypothetical protein BBW65_06345 [Helicobacter enhydrae]
MKISIVLRDITERGGGERVCANLANALSLKHQVQIISFYRMQTLIAYPLNPKINVEFLTLKGEKSGGKIQTLFKRIFYRYFLTLKAQKYLSDSQIILANDRALAPLCKKEDKRYVRLWHLNFPKKRKKFDFYDALVVLSEKERDKWEEVHSNVWVIPNFLPFETDLLTQYQQTNILCVGRMDRGDQKGFLRLLDIFAKIALEYPKWTLTLVGEGKLQSEIEQKIKDLHLQNQVIIKPFTQNIQEEYLKASFYVMSSYFEGFGMVLLESGIYGLASIAFDIYSGPSDIIENEKSGFLIKDGDLNAFACKMQLLMQSENLRQEMGKNAKKRVQEKFLAHAILPKWEKMFNSLQTHNH